MKTNRNTFYNIGRNPASLRGRSRLRRNALLMTRPWDAIKIRLVPPLFGARIILAPIWRARARLFRPGKSGLSRAGQFAYIGYCAKASVAALWACVLIARGVWMVLGFLCVWSFFGFFWVGGFGWLEVGVGMFCILYWMGYWFNGVCSMLFLI